MITPEELKEQLKPFHSGVKKAKKLLPEVLNPDEVIKWLSTDSYNKTKGLWVFTTARIFFIDLKKVILKECEYDKLTNISIDTGYLSSTVNLTIDNENIPLSVDTGNFIIVLNFLKDKISDENNKNIFLHDYPELTAKMKKKSKLGSIYSIIFLVLIVGSLFYSCSHNNPSTQNTIPESKQEKQQNNQSATKTDSETINQNTSASKTSEKAISNFPSIGATSADFSKKYKLYKDDDKTKMAHSYDNGHILAAFVDDRAVNVDISGGKNHKRDNFIKDMIPLDAQSLSKEVDNSDSALSKHIEHYHSDLLAKAIPNTTGNFDIIDVYDKSAGTYIHTVIDSDLPTK